jgi:hypothetical protein
MVLDISPTIFDLSQAQYNGAALVLPLTLPIATSSFLITNLKNLLSVPSTPPQNGLSLYTVDASSNKVAKSSFNSSGLAPSTPTTGLSYSFTRSSTSIGGSGSPDCRLHSSVPNSSCIDDHRLASQPNGYEYCGLQHPKGLGAGPLPSDFQQLHSNNSLLLWADADHPD